MLKKVLFQIVLFFIGSVGYPCIELAYRAGNCHWVMTIIGGIALMIVIDVNLLLRNRNIFLRTFVAGLAVTLMELLAGFIVNKWLQMKVWDYSYLDYNLEGQICLEFSCYWMLICFAVIVVFEFVYWIYEKFKNKKKNQYKS